MLDTLNEKTSPFTDTKTQKIFKNTANLTLKGSTYDATHLDSFLQSQYGQKGQLGRSGNHTSTYAASSGMGMIAGNQSIGANYSRSITKKSSASYVVG